MTIGVCHRLLERKATAKAQKRRTQRAQRPFGIDSLFPSALRLLCSSLRFLWSKSFNINRVYLASCWNTACLDMTGLLKLQVCVYSIKKLAKMGKNGEVCYGNL
jgi:hypothetical protein